MAAFKWSIRLTLTFREKEKGEESGLWSCVGQGKAGAVGRAQENGGKGGCFGTEGNMGEICSMAENKLDYKFGILLYSWQLTGYKLRKEGH